MVLPVIIHIMYYCMECVQVTKHLKWMHGARNQPGLLSREYQSKHDPDTHGEVWLHCGMARRNVTTAAVRPEWTKGPRSAFSTFAHFF